MMSPAGLAFNHGADLPIAEWSGDTNRLLKSERSVTMSVPAVEVSSVTHRYGDTVALSDVSFDIGDGTLTGLLGPNGSGKTTLFRLLATLLPVQSGQISVLGFDVARDASSVREQLGVTFQSPALDGRLTVEENLRWPRAVVWHAAPQPSGSHRRMPAAAGSGRSTERAGGAVVGRAEATSRTGEGNSSSTADSFAG